jgi:hypothetical protein
MQTQNGTYSWPRSVHKPAGDTVPLSQLLQVIEERSFHGCRAVHSLSLSHSGLQEIQPGALKPLASLTRLDLGYNSLANLSAWHQVEGLARLQAGERCSMERKDDFHAFLL